MGDKTIMDAEIPEEKNSRKWTPDEDERLAQLVEKYQGKCWKKVAEELKGRTDVQCLHRFGSPKSLGPLHNGACAVGASLVKWCRVVPMIGKLLDNFKAPVLARNLVMKGTCFDK
jgi:hypothetical protein